MRAALSGRSLLLFFLVLLPALCLAQNALVVHDGTGGEVAAALANLTSKLVAAGYTVTPSVGVPGGSLSGYQQIWDVRYNNTTPLSAGDITAYVTYLAGGGSLFVMGENTGFMTRNNSIIALIAAAGGGTIAVTGPSSNTQTVQPPFTGPNAVSSVTFLAAAAASSLGTGGCITRDSGNLCAAMVFGPGSMLNAMGGSLLIVFDVNFLDVTATEPLQALSSNMVAYLAAPTPIGGTGIPSPPTAVLALIGAGGAALAAVRKRLSRQRAA